LIKSHAFGTFQNRKLGELNNEKLIKELKDKVTKNNIAED